MVLNRCITFSCEFIQCTSNVENSVFKRLQVKIYNSKMMERKIASFANFMGGEIGFAVICFILFFANGDRLKSYSFVVGLGVCVCFALLCSVYFS